MANDSFKDHFSGISAAYRTARPHYPAALFEWLAEQAPDRRQAWDAGCGNGQASVALAEHFDRVVATDPSAAQIANAESHPRVEYRVERGEASSLPDHGTSLVTVAQALHWFDLDGFYSQVRRVLAPRGLFAAWTYDLCSISDAVDPIVDELYTNTVGEYWPPERRHTENGYADLRMPFDLLEVPPFSMAADWTMAQFCAYLRTWSATQRYVSMKGEDPIAAIEPALASAWGDPERALAVVWPLTVRAGRAG